MRIKPIESSQKNIRQLMFIYLALTLMALVLLSFFLVGCVKEPEVKKAQLGPEASLYKVSKALIDAMGHRSPIEIQTGDQALYEINQRVETSAIIKLQDIRIEVKSRQENKNSIIYLIDKTTVDYQGDEPETIRREEAWEVEKSQSPQLLFTPVLPSTLLSPFQWDLGKAPPVTYHSLQVTRGVRPVPTAVIRNSSNCRGLSPCHLKFTEVKFERAKWLSPDDWKITHHRYIYTPNTPYPAHLVLHCMKTLVEVEKRDYFVSQCKVLRDFIAGRDL